MASQWDTAVFYTSAEEAERETGHFAITTMVVTEALGRRITRVQTRSQPEGESGCECNT